MFFIFALFLGAFVQGLSGLGFSLVMVSVASQIFPGSTGVAVTNLFALFGNFWQLFPGKVGNVRWNLIRRVAPGVVLGVFTGVLALWLIPASLKPFFVSFSSVAALVLLLFWRPKNVSRSSELVAGTWGGLANTFAAAGGPPLAIVFKRYPDLPHRDFIQTLVTLFLFLNAVSLIFLKLPSFDELLYLVAVGVPVLVAGTVLGNWSHRFFTEKQARVLSECVVAIVAVAALVRSILFIFYS